MILDEYSILPNAVLALMNGMELDLEQPHLLRSLDVEFCKDPDFLSNCLIGTRVFRSKFLIFNRNFEFWPKLWFFTETSMFDRNFDFWLKLRSLTESSIFDQNFDIWPKLRYLTETSIFDRNFDLWPKLRFLIKTFNEKSCSLDNSNKTSFEWWGLLPPTER